MKALVVTAAGASSRFSASLGRSALKCVYHEGDASQTLLARLLGQIGGAFDRIVIVGGFRYPDLERHVGRLSRDSGLGSVELVLNERFADLASGWSLHVGLRRLGPAGCDEVVFVEGDLFLDSASVGALALGSGDAVTVSPDPVLADRSVALYLDVDGRPRYAYDAGHGALRIEEPFLGVWSSGQAWRFGDCERLAFASRAFADAGGGGTNLDIVNPYFARCDPSALETVVFREWLNCNTVDDWRRAFLPGKEDDG